MSDERDEHRHEGHTCMADIIGYLEHIYGVNEQGLPKSPITTQTIEYLENTVPKFLTKEHVSLIDFGTGPTVHNLLTLSRYFDEITMADYQEKARNELHKWKNNEPRTEGSGFNWQPYYDYVAKVEGTDAKTVESRARDHLKAIVPCDVRKDDCALPDSAPEQYDCVASFGVLLTVAVDNVEDIKRVLGHICKRLKPGGLFIYGDMVDGGEVVEPQLEMVATKQAVVHDESHFGHDRWHHKHRHETSHHRDAHAAGHHHHDHHGHGHHAHTGGREHDHSPSHCHSHGHSHGHGGHIKVLSMSAQQIRDTLASSQLECLDWGTLQPGPDDPSEFVAIFKYNPQ